MCKFYAAATLLQSPDPHAVTAPSVCGHARRKTPENMESVNGELILAVGAAAGCLAYVLLRRCGPDIPRPAGWSAQKDNAPLAELRVTLEDGKGHCIQLRRISWEQRSEVARLLSRAHAFTAPWVRIFESFSPPSIGAFEYAYTREEQASATPVSFADRDRCKKREAALAWTFERNLSLFPSNHDLYVAVDAGTGEVVGCVALVRSSSYSLASKIRVGLLNFPFVWGLQAFIRLLRLGDAFDGIEARRTRGLDPDHLRVERVAVDQRFQGHGVGRFLLREMQRLLDERGVPGFLTTQNERTVRWYETLGWRLLPGSPEWLEHESSFPFRNWSMWRECQSQPPMLTKLSHAAQSADVFVEQRLSDSAQSASDADGTYRRLWATSVTFARYLWMHPELVRGKRVVELGAGSGAIGLVCAALGASHVCITDVPGALPLIDSNVQRNPRLASGSISIAPCVWGHRSQIHEIVAKSGAFDVVVACEVIYKVYASLSPLCVHVYPCGGLRCTLVPMNPIASPCWLTRSLTSH